MPSSNNKHKASKKFAVKCIDRDGCETICTIENDKPSTAYTVVTLIISTLLAGGSVALFYTSNQENLFKLISGIVMNFFPGIYFGKDSFDTVRDLSQPSKEHTAARIIKVILGGFLFGTIATLPSVITEYIESEDSLLMAGLQFSAFPMNFAGMYGAVSSLFNIFANCLRKKEQLVQLDADEIRLIRRARETLLINLLRADPAIRSAYKHAIAEIDLENNSHLSNVTQASFIPSKRSLGVRLYFALRALEAGKDPTKLDKFFYRANKPLTAGLGIIFSMLLLVSTLGYLASTRQLFDAEKSQVKFLRFANPWDWISSAFLMLPAAYFSISGGFSVAAMLTSTMLIWAISSRFPRPLEVMLGNNLMRAILAMGFFAAVGLGWDSGATAKILYEKYFPDFQNVAEISWLNKRNLSGLIEFSAAGFNIIYFLLFATLLAVRGFYRNFGFAIERANVDSHDNYENLIQDVESLTPPELAYVLKDIHRIAERNSESKVDVAEITSATEQTRLLTGTDATLLSAIAEVPQTVEKALGSNMAALVANKGIFSKPDNSKFEKDMLAPTVAVANRRLPSQQLILNQDPEAEFEQIPEKKGSRCTIL